MNLQDQVIYRCIHAACARPMPRRVDFCPYCGTGQHDGAVRPVHAPGKVDVIKAAPPAARVEPVMEASSEPAFVQEPPPVPPQPKPASAPAAPPRAAPRLGGAAAPPQRKPIRLRYWLMALAVLALIWIAAKPNSKKLDTRVEQATLLAQECNFKDAQAELIALREDKASAAQLQRVQAAINAAVSACDKKRSRAVKPKAAAKREVVVTPAKPVDAAQDRPPAQSPGQSAQLSAQPSGQSARNLIAEAERALAQGNYKAAVDKLDTCIAMVEGSRECAAFKKHADRLLKEMQRCVAAGRDWTSDRCM